MSGEKIKLKIIDKLYKFATSIGSNLMTAAEVLKFMKFDVSFGQRDDDIYISSFPKSGTTWMQMLMYQLTTDGNMDFDHIYDVSPWIRNAAHLGIEPKDIPSPRIIKTHDTYKWFPSNRKGRFIYVMRSGIDVAASYYHHQKNYDNPLITFDEVFKGTFIERTSMNWFDHVSEWLNNKHQFPMLVVTYEELQYDMDKVINKIVDFCGLTLNPADLPRIKERSSFEFMKKHQDKFGEKPQQPLVFDQFIRKGKVGEGESYFSDEQVLQYHDIFNKVLAPYQLTFQPKEIEEKA